MDFPAPSRAQAISQLVRPRSIAIIGASSDLAKVNGRPLKHLQGKGYAGRILPVNPKYTDIAGLPCYRDVAALPEVPDLAVVVVPAAEVLHSISELGIRGVRAAVIFSSGFGEMGPGGKALEAAVLARARDHNMVICGPNCLGFINAFDNVYATFSQYADGETSAGPIAFVTQSGAFGTAIAALVRQRGLGLGYFINTGNEADLTFCELMAAVLEDPRIRVAAGYLEGLHDGASLVRLAQRCQALGKPLVLIKVGRLEAGARAAASHTGALAVQDAVFDAVVRQYGVLRAGNEEQMLDMLEALSQPRVPLGKGLGIVTQSGGAGVMMADRAQELGLDVSQPGPETRARLASVVPAFGAIGNPVDVTGQFVARPDLFRDAVVRLMEDPQIHVCLIWLQLMTAHVDRLVPIFVDIGRSTTKPFFVCWVAAPSQALVQLRAAGIVVFRSGECAVEAASALVRHHGYQRAAALPEHLPAAVAATMQTEWKPGLQDSVSAVACLRAAGIPMAEVALAQDEEQAVALWRAMGQSVAMKIESPDIAHKTELGGVRLALTEASEVRAAYGELIALARRARPQARLIGVLVQPMVPGRLELVVGVQRDPVFGMVVMVGIGGILVEVLKDVAMRLAPFGIDEGLRMLAELRAGAVLNGVRGQPAVDRRLIATLLSRLSVWAAGMQPVMAELDLNPVILTPEGPVAVDCVMIVDPLPAHVMPLTEPPNSHAP
ncbi:MAG: acetate--CoA ligase family protein [Betaproteobacteria bacterium]